MQGIINLYKPVGISSFGAVAKVRSLTGIKKIGHTGTLDPLASGILPICIGNSTKFVDYIMLGEKKYKTLLKLGVTTDTYDEEGTILEEKEVSFSEDDLINVIKSFIGVSYQIPPMYSAIKKNGKKLYELARQGIEIEREGRKIEIFNIEILEINMPYATFIVHCSKGTYIRSLCSDIGEKLNCGGIMSGLERIENGLFKKEDSIDLSSLTKENIESFILPIDNALLNYPKVSYNKVYEKSLINGVRQYSDETTSKLINDTIYRVYIENSFKGLGKKENDSFKMIKLLV